MEALSAFSSRISNRPDPVQAGAGIHNPFKLMLVHDGHQHIHHAIDDLKNCGLPADSEVLLLSVGELFRTPLHWAGKSIGGMETHGAARIRSLVSYRKNHELFKNLDAARRDACAKLLSAFPRWEIRFERLLGWQPDLILLVVYSRSSAQNPGLGDIIRKISTESSVPFRVARPRTQNGLSRGPSVIAFDSSASAVAAVTALRRRSMDNGSNAHLMFYLDPLMSQAQRWSAGYEEPDREWIDSQLIRTKRAIEALGYNVSCSKIVGNTAQAILNEAKRMGAESILLGTAALQVLGSLSAESIAVTVAAESECSVELAFSALQERPAAALQPIAASQWIAA